MSGYRHRLAQAADEAPVAEPPLWAVRGHGTDKNGKGKDIDVAAAFPAWSKAAALGAWWRLCARLHVVPMGHALVFRYDTLSPGQQDELEVVKL